MGVTSRAAKGGAWIGLALAGLPLFLVGGCASSKASVVEEKAPAPVVAPAWTPPPSVMRPAVPVPDLRPQVTTRRVPARPQVTGRLDVPINRRWDYIVIHHSATPSGNEAEFDRYAKRQRGWDGVGYHFVIGNGSGSSDGEVEVTFRWERQMQGAHAGVEEYNQHGVGICLVGDFERDRPTQRQMLALASLVNYLQERCNIPTAHVLMHRHVRVTKCPGRNFPYYELLAMLDR